MSKPTQPQLTNQEYHDKKEYLSASGIKTLLKNPYEFLHPKEVSEKTQANFDFGSALHSLVLEPENFEKEFAVAPKINLRTKAGKEEYSNFYEKNSDKIILKNEDYETAKEMAQSILSVSEVKNFLDLNGVAEQSFFSEIDGYKVKCRPDYYVEELGLVIDLKTTADASPDGFAKSIANFGYHIQAAFYLDVLQSLGKKANQFLFIAVEKTAPFMVGLYTLDGVAINFGREKYKEAFTIYDNLDKLAKKPIYQDVNTEAVVQELSLPNYIFYK